MRIAVTGMTGRFGRLLAQALHRKYALVGIDRSFGLYGALDVGGEVERTRQGRRLENLDAVLLCFFPDTGGDRIGALGQQYRRSVAIRIIRQRNGKVFRVGDDDIGVFDAIDHACIGHLALTPTDLRLDLGATLHVLHLVPYFLLGHAHLFHVLPFLERHINERDHNQRAGHDQR